MTARVVTRTRPLVLLLVLALVALVPVVPATAGAATPSAAPSVTAATTSRAPARAPAARAGDGWRTEERMVPVQTGPDRDVPLELDTRLYVPDSATARSPKPAILMTHGFGLTKDATEVVDTAELFASHGYVVLTWTSSGFGDSGGCITLQSADWDVPSARQLIDEVLEPRAFVKRDRRGVVVGTIGGSYGGGIQLPLAAADDRIRTAVPGRTWSSLAYSLDPNNRIVPGDRSGFAQTRNTQGVFKQQWTSLFYASGNTQPAQGNGGCPEAKAVEADPEELAGASSCPGYYLELCRTYALLSSTGDSDPAARRLLARAAATSFLDDVDVPVLLVQGQSDTLFNLNDAVATYTGLKRRGVPVGMIWNSGGHGGYSSQPGECEVYDGVDRTVAELDRCYLTRRAVQWMDHWLKGRDGGRGPGFAWYRDWTRYGGSGPADEQYGTASGFPLPQRTRFTLSGTSQLTPARVARRGTVSIVNPADGRPAAYSETSNFSGPDSEPSSADVPPQEVEGQHVSFTSRALRRPLRSVGVPAARLRVSHTNGQDLVLFAKVYDVAPDGGTELIHRLIAPVRVPAGSVDAAEPSPVRLKLAGFAHRFGAGHRVRLVVCTTDQTSYNSQVADVVTLTTGRGSTFTLPGRAG
ncbi:CocE/NonD family hydrolase [Nocardioides sp. HDW12B]|uniref:CocE/NonD family hydrolase n=1 Tax=Nocardioides sp. HDW12B TaxID=2714939 RepID=UPI00140D4C8F|nr:CocE/NonD family hydrolase [Nocardioides sp. HDW12B]QIK66496.1 CocE/NonD family hydrolase [Nocardioides sp. HDW12B]